MDELLGQGLSLFNCLVMLSGVCSTFLSNYSCMMGIFSTLLPYNCSSGTASFDSAAAQGQRSSVNVQYELCDQSTAELTSFIIFVGMGVGSLIVGPMSDTIGRWRTLTVCSIVAAAANFTSTYCTQFWLHLLCRCLSGCSVIAVQCAFMVYGNEVLPQAQRAMCNSSWGIGVCIGGWVLPIVAYVSKQHQTVGLISGIAACTMLVTLLWLPESPIWLLERGQVDRAVASLRHMSLIDCRAAPSHERVEQLAKKQQQQQQQHQQQQQQSLIQSLLQMDPRSRLDLSILLLHGFSITAANYGLFFSVSKVVTDVYLYVLVGFVVYLPAVILMSVWPRHLTLMVTGLTTVAFCSGIALLLFLFPEMPPAVGWAVIILGLCGIFVSSCGFSATLAAGSERFPTAVRNTCVGLLCLATRFGAVSPQVVVLIPSVPLRILTLVLPLVVTCWPALLLPDTRRMQMHTIGIDMDEKIDIVVAEKSASDVLLSSEKHELPLSEKN